MLLISNGRVLDPASGTDAPRDILLDGDRIAARRAARAACGARRRARKFSTPANLIVAPGFIDLHCHLREPGGESSETIETGTRAAARGGFTAVCPMPNTRPVNDNASVTRSILERAAAVSPVRVWPIGAASVGSKGEALAEIAAMKQAGIVAVSDDGRPIATAKLLRQVMEYCRALDLPVIDHCEDSSLFAGAVMREGKQSVRLGLRGMPAATESLARRARRADGRADQLPPAHRASFGARFARTGARRQGERPAASPAKSRRIISRSPMKTCSTTRATK